MLKKFLAVIAVLSLSFSAVAQNIEGVNARLDGMAGSGPSDDIGWTIKHPASIFNYPNHYQGTICLMDIPGIGKTYGAIIGIVQFSEVFYAGVVLNNRIVMGGGFYDKGAHFLNAQHIDGADNAKGFPNIPAVNFCLKLSDNFQLGLGGYFEGAAYDLDDDKKLPYATATGMDTVFYSFDHDNKRLRNMGVNVEARFKVGGWTIYPQVIVGFPQMMGSETADTLDQVIAKYTSANNATAPFACANLENTYSSKEGLYLRGGSYFWGDIGNTFWLAGALYENARHQFVRNTKRDSATVDIDGSLVNDTTISWDFDTSQSDHNDQWIHYFLSFVPSFSDNLYFAPEYDGGIGWYKANDPDLPPDTTFFMIYHSFRLGIESFIDDFWWFDKLGLRCGMSAQWNKEWRHVEHFDDVTGTSDESMPWKSFFWGSDFTKKEAKITGGFGVTKGRATFDISCDFLKWQGQSVLTGPAAAMASMTVDFSRKKEF